MPMMIGDKVPDGDEHWTNFLDLLKVTDLLLAPELTEDDVCCMSVMIADHHQQFRRLYPHASITPKIHYLLHMARLILKYVLVFCALRLRSTLALLWCYC